MALEFKEHKGATDNGEESTVRAATVGDDDAGSDVNVIGGVRTLNKNDVVVERDRPGFYDVFTPDEWKNTGYGGSSESAETGTASEPKAPGSTSSAGSNTGAEGRAAKNR